MGRVGKVRATELLQQLLDLIPELRQESMDSQAFTKWQRDTRVAIENIFGESSSRVTEFNQINFSPLGIFFGPDDRGEFQRAYVSGLERANAVLQSMVEEIEEYWPDDAQTLNPTNTPENRTRTNTNQIFIIHGRERGTRDMVVRFLERLELQPVVLQEQPDRGRTIIEKFEEYAQVDFAIALFTPDDMGGLEGDGLQHRARQNVIFEFGYFIGRYGRDRTLAMVKGDMEIPSDYSGVLYISLDDSDGWKTSLIRELKTAGFGIDANRLFE